MRSLLIGVSVATIFGATAAGALELPGARPGAATAELKEGRLVMGNQLLAATWSLADGRLTLMEVADLATGNVLRAAASDSGPTDGATLKLSAARVVDGLKIERIAPRADAVSAAERSGGARATAILSIGSDAVRLRWQAVLRDDSNYIRQEVTLLPSPEAAKVERLVLIDLPATEARAAGEVDGSPVVCGNLFLACEHPMASNGVDDGRIVCMVGTYPNADEPRECVRSTVVGVVPPGQLRRGFLYYLERERPRPYAPFLHYNSWYDIAWGDRKMNETQCIEVIEAFGREFVDRRGGKLDSAVFDDGWDDNRTLWRFHDGFPRGFSPLSAAAARHQTAVGVWLSPWGGYGGAKAERMEYGKTQGFETNARGFSLAGPKYYGRFREVCREMVERYGVNYFKFDGIAQGLSSTGAGESFAADVDALLRLCRELRGLRPDLYLSITTGTWPSPCWLFFGDSVWRNGSDMDFFGPGTMRQQWITYRDMHTYKGIVRRAPLYPVNSLMTQGIVHAQLGPAARMSTELKDWNDEVRSFFATGTQLQELYITPKKLTPEMWDSLAEGAAWSRENADVLVDAHWIGGDPAEGQVYGVAAWSPRLGTLMLRNPAASPADFSLDIGRALELPEGAAREYRLVWPWSGSPPRPEMTVRAGESARVELAPFETAVFEVMPVE